MCGRVGAFLPSDAAHDPWRRQARMPVPPPTRMSVPPKSLSTSEGIHMSNISRRTFLHSAGTTGIALAAATAGLPVVTAAAADQANSTGAHDGPKFRLGIVTYNIAAQWDLPTLLKVMKSVGIGPVEFRTGHKHGVEPTLSKED